MRPVDSTADAARRPLCPPCPIADTPAAPPRSAGQLPSPRGTICLSAPALLVEARFRDLTLASRLLRADRPGRFTIGPARGTDAPVNPVWLGGADELPAHVLVERVDATFVVGLAAAMVAQLWTPHQRLPLRPDAGRAEAPLELQPDTHLRIPCGEVTFEIRSAEAEPALPRPWMPAGWLAGLRYPAGVAVALAILIGLVRMVPSDPRALSLDVFGADRRLDRTVVIPLDVAAPVMDRVLRAASPGGSRAAAGPSGQAGSRRAPVRDTRMATSSPTRSDARQAAARARSAGVLAVLDGPPAGALADLLSSGPAMGADARDVMGHLEGTTIADAYGIEGLGARGTGAGAAGTGERTFGLGVIGTRGRFGGDDTGYGTSVGQLGTRHAHPPEILLGSQSVRGMLDKEIIRRTVRRHLNEVRYCYEQGLTARPSLSGRVVVQFTIAPTGRVLVALTQSSTLAAAAVESCVVGAVRRWEFPQPEGGGLVSVSYPFAFSPAGQ